MTRDEIIQYLKDTIRTLREAQTYDDQRDAEQAYFAALDHMDAYNERRPCDEEPIAVRCWYGS